MNVAVQKGAKENQSFAAYVTWLAEKHFIPPGTEEWVDEIRKVGNDATHEIALVSEGDSAEVLSFAEMLLKQLYEFPARLRAKRPPA